MSNAAKGTSSGVKIKRAAEGTTSVVKIKRPKIMVTTPREKHVPLLIAQFSSLDRVLYQKKKVVDWETLNEAVARSCGSQIELTDLDAILAVYPMAYKLYWQVDSTDHRLFRLSIRLPAESIRKMEARSNTFRENLDSWCILHPGDQKIVAKITSIPPKPQNLMDNPKNSTCSVSKIALIAEEQRKIQMDGQRIKSSATGRESLNESKMLAEKRHLNKDILASQLLKQQNLTILKNRIASLPSLCDALRSKYWTSNRASMKTKDLMQIMTSELFLTRKELMNRLDLLTDIIPEFITILPADKLVSFSIVRLDLQTPYNLIQQKVVTYVNSTS